MLRKPKPKIKSELPKEKSPKVPANIPKPKKQKPKPKEKEKVIENQDEDDSDGDLILESNRALDTGSSSENKNKGSGYEGTPPGSRQTGLKASPWGPANMGTFGRPIEIRMRGQNSEKPVSKGKEEIFPDDSFQQSTMPGNNSHKDDFQSFGLSVKTAKVYNNLSKMFTQLVNSVRDSILLDGLEIIEEHSKLVTGGSRDKTLRFWNIITENGNHRLEIEHEMAIFRKSITNIKYLSARELLLAGDSNELYIFDMRDYFRSGKQPEDIERLTNKHWLRCIYHHDTHEHDWLLFAKAHSIYYYDLDKMRLLDLKAQNLKENVMCFEKVNDRYMMVGSGRVICFWDVENARQVGKQSQHHDKYINKIYYIKKKRTVLSGGDDGFIYLYRMKESKPELSLRQKISPSGSTEKSFIDSLIYFEGQAMLFCSNRTNSLTIFCFNSSNNLKEKSQITNLSFKVTGLCFWKAKTSLLAYSSLEDKIIIFGIMGQNH